MSWITPKIDWVTNDGVEAVDLNRIEGNIKSLGTSVLRKGLVYYANNANAGGSYYNIRVAGGNLPSQSAAIGMMPGTFDIQKILSSTTWAAGNGTASPCRCPGSVAVTANQWWFVFALYNPTTEAFDICMDDNFAGSNIQGSAITTAGYTMWKRVACQFEYGGAVTPHLTNTMGIRNHFYISESPVPITVAKSSYSTNDFSLINGTTGVSIAPPGISLPVMVNIESSAICVLQIWSGLLDATGSYYTEGTGIRCDFQAAGQQMGAVTVIPDASDALYVYVSTGTPTLTVTLMGWIDDRED